MELSDASSMDTYQMVYYASAQKEKRVIDQTLTLVDGVMDAVGSTHYPTVVYVYSASGKLMTVFYAERGDEIVINGNITPWEVKGNEINEDWSAWRKKNATALNAHDWKMINQAVAEYVRKHPKNKLSTLLLANDFEWRDNEKEYRSLWSMLSGSACDKELITALGVDYKTLTSPYNQAIKSLEIIGPGDTVYKILPTESDYTVLYFWHNPDRRVIDLQQLRTTLKASKSTIKVAEVNMQSDTLGWSYRLQRDTICSADWLHGWAPGAMRNKALEKLNIPSLPYYIIIDKKGTQIYRGKLPQIPH